MPIEIRELIIKTEIVSDGHNFSGRLKEKELGVFKKQLMEECKRIISDGVKRKNYKR